jgi:PAS domain S-box-containing protein
LQKGLDGGSEALGRVLEAVPEVMVVIDLEGTILYINHVEKGYDRERVLGTKADTIMPPASRATFWAALDSVAKTRGNRRVRGGGIVSIWRTPVLPESHDAAP